MIVMTGAGALPRLDDLRGSRPLVLVPTMGALHEGHLSLVRHGADIGPVVVSIFVNPTQFGPGEDFAAYPRDLDRDLALLKRESASAVFVPEVADMYGAPGEGTIRAGSRALGMCGASRPGHFDGVLTVVAKLFDMIQPQVAVFGRKDAQQCLVVDQMVRDLRLSVRLVDAPTVREPDGLAMSSRNRYLDAGERRRALCLSGALNIARGRLLDGERRAASIETMMREALRSADALEYAVVRTVPDLGEREIVEGRVVLAVAARVGPARLIDNMVLRVGPRTVDESNLLGNDMGQAAR